MPDFARSADRNSSRLAPTGRPARQPRPNLADQLERLTPRFDSMTQRARLGNDVHTYLDVEELAHAFCRDLMTAVRGGPVQPSAAPLYVNRDGREVIW